jgi:hypothetical protein
MLVLMGKRGPEQPPRIERFWMRVDKTDDCWLWTGVINHERGGYGYFYDDDQRLRRAHRVAWELETGEVLPPSVALCHECDTPACVRPSHMFKGTQTDNMKDMRRKGRGHTFTPDNVERGGDRYNAVLNDDLVRELRAIRAAGGNVTAAARRMGVSQAAAQLAASGKSWRHVT